MYQILRRSPERLAQYGREARTASSPLILHMQENRSHLSDEARGAVASLAFALMAGAILPAFEGLLFVPIAALSALALLTFALERHARAAHALPRVAGLKPICACSSKRRMRGSR